MTAKDKRLIEQGPADALGEGAARFDQLIESVKRRNQPAPRSAPSQPSNPLLTASPGEEWARQFQTQAIGPETGSLSPASFAVVAKRLVFPASEERIAPSPANIASKLEIGAPDIRFGRPEKPRRSLLGRLFSRS